MAALWQAMRPQQWLKNVLILVPVVLSHHIRDIRAVERALLAMFVFSMCASAVYVFNDVLDRDADRRHPTKKDRAVASGRLSISAAAMAALVLLVLAFALATITLDRGTVAILALYLVTTTAYSLGLKKIVILDVLILSGLYTLRIFFGAQAIGSPVSTWLTAFSFFFFFSLAMAKRFGELTRVKKDGGGMVRRGYREEDMAIVANFGSASGYVSVLVMALYVNSQDVMALYRQPKLLWIVCPMLLYWISRLWLLADRGELDEEPIAFAMKDPVSYLVGFLSLLVIWLSTVGANSIRGL